MMTDTALLWFAKYNALVRQGRIYDSGDDPEGDWWPVNASDLVGIVGEFLGK